METITFNGSKYLLHIVNKDNFSYYEDILENVNICDSKFLEKSYEQLGYFSLELDNYYGFFLTDLDNRVIYCSLILDLNNNQTENYFNIRDLTNTITILLLCSNKNFRVSGLTRLLLKLVIDKYLSLIKPNVKKILLSVSRKDENPHAVSFYRNFGFKDLHNQLMELTIQKQRSYLKPKKQLKYEISKKNILRKKSHNKSKSHSKSYNKNKNHSLNTNN